MRWFNALIFVTIGFSLGVGMIVTFGGKTPPTKEYVYAPAQGYSVEKLAYLVAHGPIWIVDGEGIREIDDYHFSIRTPHYIDRGRYPVAVWDDFYEVESIHVSKAEAQKIVCVGLTAKRTELERRIDSLKCR